MTPTVEELIRRLQHMYVTNSDSAQWYRNQIAQTLRRFNALPPKLEWEAAACRGALLYAEDAIARDGKEKP